MARYGCLVIGTILALIILFVIVYFWSGWLNRPVGHSIATTESPARPVMGEGSGRVFRPHPNPSPGGRGGKMRLGAIAPLPWETDKGM